MVEALVFGIVVGMAVLLYATAKGVTESEREERQKEKDEENTRLTDDQIEEQKRMAAISMKQTLYEMNPDLKNLNEEELQQALRERKSTFLNRLPEDARNKFLEYADQTKKEMNKLNKLTPKQLKERAGYIEANEFRVLMFKFIVVFLVVYFI